MKLQIANYDDKLNKEQLLDCTFYHDICGNLYIKAQDKYFMLVISITDDIEWIEISNYENLPKVNNNISYSGIKNTYEKNSLKGKVTKELEENDDDDELDEDGYYQNKHKVYPEEKLYVTDNTNNSNTENNINSDDNNNNDNDNDDLDSDELENYYRFSKFGNDSIITCLDRTLDVLANYDTFVMNNNTSYVLTTLQAAEKSEYRVSLFISGKMLLNVVGTRLNTYDLYYTNKDNELLIICDRLHTKFVI